MKSESKVAVGAWALDIVSMQHKALIILFLLLVGSALTLAQEAPITQAPPPITFPEWKEVGRTATSIEYSISFPSSFETRYPVNNTVPLRILLPLDRKDSIPAVLVMHFWGARDFKVERTLAAELNRRGIAAVLLTLPYHMNRTPAGYKSGQLTVQPDTALLAQNMIQSVQDARRSIDWIESRPEFRHDVVGITGTSLGAVVSSAVYALEPRVTHAVFVLGGVDLAHIIWNSSRVVRERDELRGKGYTEGRLRKELQPIEPLTYLKQRGPGTTYVIGAKFDTVVPPGSTEELIQALDRPRTLFVDTGHYGGIFVERKLLREMAQFFGAELGGKTYAPPTKIYAPTVRIGALLNTGSGFDLAAGIDLLKFDRKGSSFLSMLLTPRGAQVFLGHKIDSRISVGFFGSTRRSGVGLIWSTVL